MTNNLNTTHYNSDEAHQNGTSDIDHTNDNSNIDDQDSLVDDNNTIIADNSESNSLAAVDHDSDYSPTLDGSNNSGDNPDMNGKDSFEDNGYDYDSDASISDNDNEKE